MGAEDVRNAQATHIQLLHPLSPPPGRPSDAVKYLAVLCEVACYSVYNYADEEFGVYIRRGGVVRRYASRRAKAHHSCLGGRHRGSEFSGGGLVFLVAVVVRLDERLIGVDLVVDRCELGLLQLHRATTREIRAAGPGHHKILAGRQQRLRARQMALPQKAPFPEVGHSPERPSQAGLTGQLGAALPAAPEAGAWEAGAAHGPLSAAQPSCPRPRPGAIWGN